MSGDNTLASSVRASELRAYFLSRGWVIKPFKQTNAVLFEKSVNGKLLVQLIPGSESLADYPLRVPEILRALSVIEGRPEVEILQNIIHP